MTAPINQLKAALAAGEPLFGIWLGTAEPYMAEIAASAGFDWLLIDGEHGPNDLRSISAQIGALAGKKSATILRLPDGNSTTIKQALDLGVQTLVIPMVETAAQARDLLAATRYPPAGYRGIGSALARASDFGARKDYLATANDQICLILQVESRAGLEQLDDILALDGIDAIFIGPSDLAADMGHLGNPAAPEVQAAIATAMRKITASGKRAGVLATNQAAIATYRSHGATFLGVGIDVTLYADSLRNLAAQYR